MFQDAGFLAHFGRKVGKMASLKAKRMEKGRSHGLFGALNKTRRAKKGALGQTYQPTSQPIIAQIKKLRPNFLKYGF
jgi:hypothetical protein